MLLHCLFRQCNTNLDAYISTNAVVAGFDLQQHTAASTSNLNLPSITAAAYPASSTAAAATPAVMFSSVLRNADTSLSEPLLRVADALITQMRLLLLNPEVCEARAIPTLRFNRWINAIAVL
jgi:hypothetical protein